MIIKCYTDGSCSGNPGPGGYSASIKFSDFNHIVLGGHKLETTNNEMELLAVMNALIYICKNIDGDKKYRIDFYSDSAYVVNSINQGWVDNWERNGWINRQNAQVKNLHIWKDLIKYYRKLNKNPNIKLNIVKVKGHSGHKENDLVDKLAKLSRDKKLEFVKEFPSSKGLNEYVDRL